MTTAHEAKTPEGLSAQLVGRESYNNLSASEQRAEFSQNGFVVVPEAVPSVLCDELLQTYSRDFKPQELARRADKGGDPGFEQNGC